MTPKRFALILVAGAATLFLWESISNVALPWHRMTMPAVLAGIAAGVEITVPTLLRQLALDVLVAAIALLAMVRLPRGTTLQYATVFGVAGLALSLSTFGSQWNWWGFPWAWTAVQVMDRTIGFALMGFAMGFLANRDDPRRTTDEWGGVRAQGGLPTATRNGSVRR